MVKHFVRRLIRRHGKQLVGSVVGSYGARKSVQKARQKQKQSRSHTQTKTKKKRSSGADDQHSGIGARSITIKLHPTLKGQGYGSWKFAQNYAGTMASVAGTQYAGVIMGICHRNQFLTDTAVPNVAQIKQNLFDLNYSRAIVGSGLVPVTGKPATDRLCVYNVRTNMMFTNLESVSAVLTLYVVTPKRDTGLLSDTVWGTALTGEGLGVAVRTRAAAGLYGGTTAGTGSSSDVFAKPTELQFFKDQYRVLRVIRLRMAAGATEEVNIRTYVNKIAKMQLIQEQVLESMRGFTVQILATVYGQVVHDNTGGALTMTTASTKIGFVQTCTYTCGLTKAVGASRVDDYYTNQQIATAVAPANQISIDIQDVAAGVDQA